jgi:hypothetical protein
MATPADYAVVQHVILRDLDAYVNKFVPDLFGYKQKALAEMPIVAQSCAKDAVDALDTSRKNNNNGEQK